MKRLFAVLFFGSVSACAPSDEHDSFDPFNKGLEPYVAEANSNVVESTLGVIVNNPLKFTLKWQDQSIDTIYAGVTRSGDRVWDRLEITVDQQNKSATVLVFMPDVSPNYGKSYTSDIAFAFGASGTAETKKVLYGTIRL